MKRWLRRLIYGLLIFLWLLLIIFPLFAFLLAAGGELQLGNDPQNHLRLFLLQEEETQGVGVEWVRPSRNVSNCRQRTVAYLLWEGDGENVVSCQCSDPRTGELMSATFQACPAP